MKRFILLLKLEYNRIFLPLLFIVAAMAILQSILFVSMLRNLQGHVPLSSFIDAAGLNIIFAIAFGCLLALIGASFAMSFVPSKSIYALLTLPTRREWVYLAKLAAGVLAAFVLVASQMVLLLVFSEVAGVPFLRGVIAGFEVTRRSADFYLALLDVDFLRLLFPSDLFSLVFAVLGIVGSVSVTLFGATQVAAGKVFFAMVVAVSWLGLLMITLPLIDAPVFQNVVSLVFTMALVVATGVEGARNFGLGKVIR